MGNSSTVIGGSSYGREEWEEYGYDSPEEYESFDWAYHEVDMGEGYENNYQKMVQWLYDHHYRGDEDYEPIVDMVHAQLERNSEWNNKSESQKQKSNDELKKIENKLYDDPEFKSGPTTNPIKYGDRRKNRGYDSSYGSPYHNREVNMLSPLPKLKPRQTYTIMNRYNGAKIEIGYKDAQNLNIYSVSSKDTVVLESSKSRIELGSQYNIYFGKTSKAPTQGGMNSGYYGQYKYKNLKSMASEPVKKYEESYNKLLWENKNYPMYFNDFTH